jgi:hypothetical protein
MPYESFDTIAYFNHTDKVEHGYTILYDELFLPLRFSFVRALEIGFDRGKGARSLAEYFPRGVIHSIDYNKERSEGYFSLIPDILRQRMFLYAVDQSNREQLTEFAAEFTKVNNNGKDKKFRLILDDGSHRPHDQILSFEVLWDALADGGYYIIEDLHCCYKDGKHETVEYFMGNFYQTLARRANEEIKGFRPSEAGWVMFPYNSIIIKKPGVGLYDLR